MQHQQVEKKCTCVLGDLATVVLKSSEKLKKRERERGIDMETVEKHERMHRKKNDF